MAMIWRQKERSVFPPAETAGEGGVLGYTDDLDCRILGDAYWNGIFPWPYETETVVWCSPPLRGVLPLDRFHLPRRLKRALKKMPFQFRIDTAFDRVIEECAAVPRPGEEGTWITPKIIAAYKKFHRLGFAHSFEAFDAEGNLAGGLYGVSIGRIFCGESMFYRQSGASKFAFVHAVAALRRAGVVLIDTQMVTPLTASFGAYEVTREKYLALLAEYRGGPVAFADCNF